MTRQPNVREIEPEIDMSTLLVGAQFIDAWSVTVDHGALDARHAAEKMLARGPRWVDTLVKARNLVVTPFGLITPSPDRAPTPGTIGIFPVLSETPDRLVAGLNDRHLDFRLVVDVAGAGQSQRVTATTVVLTHNWLGRIYLAVIMPFHRLIVRTLLRQVIA